MTREDIIRMAREAGLEIVHFTSTPEAIERFAALVADAANGDYTEGWEEGYKFGVIDERKACAKVCEELGAWNNVAQDCAAAILARGEA